MLLLALAFNLFISICFSDVKVQAVEQNQNPVSVEPTSGQTPLMGWSSWNAFHIDIDEDIIKAQADIMASSGMMDAGYEYINVDDGYFGGRDADGVLYANEKFPSGMKDLADYIHSKDLKAGIYTDAGTVRCAPIYDADPHFPEGGGSFGYRQLDFDTFINDWGYDFVKVDWCGGQIQKLDPETEYKSIKENIIATGKDILWEICNWTFPGVWATDIASHWRISGDIAPNFNSITTIIDLNAGLAEYASPGHFNHMDMLQVGNGMSYEEDKSHFSMWSIMASPLLTGNDLREMSEETLSILTNKEVIAVNQDSLGIQAERVKKNGGQEIWAKPLENYTSGAVALFNRGNSAATMTVNFEEVGVKGPVSVRDLWEHEDKGIFEESYTVEVPAHGIVMLKVEGDTMFGTQKVDYNKNMVEDLQIDMVDKGSTLTSITNGDETLIEGSHYTVNDKKVIIKSTYLQNVPEGQINLTLNYTDNWRQVIEINIYGEPYTYYLSDLPWVKATSGWEKVRRDKGHEGYDLKLNDIIYKKGLWANSHSEIIYNLEGKYKDFKAIVGNDDNQGSPPGIGSITFEVWADGNKLFDSGLMLGDDPTTQDVSVNVEGVQELKLIVTDGGDNTWYDRAIWADAKLIVASNVDVTELENLIQTAKGITNEDGAYTESAFQALQEAIVAAQEVLDNTEATQDVVNAKIIVLKAAIDGLVVEAETPSALLIQEHVAQLLAEGEITNDSTARSLKVHLSAVERYENQDAAKKVVKHTKGFILLLDHLSEGQLISSKAYNLLKADADLLIEKWQ